MTRWLPALLATALLSATGTAAGRPNVVLENEQQVRSGTEGEWHGTAVASTIGAAQNAIGMEGLYPTVRLGAWDGGDRAKTRKLRIEVEPEAIRICVPPPA